MRYEISKRFRFEAAHWLPLFPDGHKCRRLHGHSFEVEVFVGAETLDNAGIVLDYGEISGAVKPLVDMLDHTLLNEHNWDLLQNPTSENIAQWFYEQLDGNLCGLSAVGVYETCNTSCIYRPEQGQKSS